MAIGGWDIAAPWPKRADARASMMGRGPLSLGAAAHRLELRQPRAEAVRLGLDVLRGAAQGRAGTRRVGREARRSCRPRKATVVGGLSCSGSRVVRARRKRLGLGRHLRLRGRRRTTEEALLRALRTPPTHGAVGRRCCMQHNCPLAHCGAAGACCGCCCRLRPLTADVCDSAANGAAPAAASRAPVQNLRIPAREVVQSCRAQRWQQRTIMLMSAAGETATRCTPAMFAGGTKAEVRLPGWAQRSRVSNNQLARCGSGGWRHRNAPNNGNKRQHGADLPGRAGQTVSPGAGCVADGAFLGRSR